MTFSLSKFSFPHPLHKPSLPHPHFFPLRKKTKTKTIHHAIWPHGERATPQRGFFPLTPLLSTGRVFAWAVWSELPRLWERYFHPPFSLIVILSWYDSMLQRYISSCMLIFFGIADDENGPTSSNPSPLPPPSFRHHHHARPTCLARRVERATGQIKSPTPPMWSWGGVAPGEGTRGLWRAGAGGQMEREVGGGGRREGWRRREGEETSHEERKIEWARQEAAKRREVATKEAAERRETTTKGAAGREAAAEAEAEAEAEGAAWGERSCAEKKRQGTRHSAKARQASGGHWASCFPFCWLFCSLALFSHFMILDYSSWEIYSCRFRSPPPLSSPNLSLYRPDSSTSDQEESKISTWKTAKALPLPHLSPSSNLINSFSCY